VTTRSRAGAAHGGDLADGHEAGSRRTYTSPASRDQSLLLAMLPQPSPPPPRNSMVESPAMQP